MDDTPFSLFIHINNDDCRFKYYASFQIVSETVLVTNFFSFIYKCFFLFLLINLIFYNYFLINLDNNYIVF